MQRMSLTGVLVISLSLWMGCNSGSGDRQTNSLKQPAEKQGETTQTKAGRTAFQRLYVTARNWAPDALPISLRSQPLPGIPGQDGKAAIWRAVFASPSRSLQKPFVWSGIESEDTPSPGITPGIEDSFNSRNVSMQPFQTLALQIDSDKAFAIAQEHGGKAQIAKDANIAIAYQLDWSPRENELLWHVLYGRDPDTRLRVAVDASSGGFVRVEK